MDASITQVGKTLPSKSVSKSASGSSSGTAFETLLRGKRQEQSFKTKKGSDDLSEAATAQGANVQDATNARPVEPKESAPSQNNGNKPEALEEPKYTLSGLKFSLKAQQGQSMLWQAGMDASLLSAEDTTVNNQLPVQNPIQMELPDTKGQVLLQEALTQAGSDILVSEETLADTALNQAAYVQESGVTKETLQSEIQNVSLSANDKPSKMSDLLQSVTASKDNRLKHNDLALHQQDQPNSLQQSATAQGTLSVQGAAASGHEEGKNSLSQNAGTKGANAQTGKNAQQEVQDSTLTEVRPEQIAQPESKVSTPVQTQNIEQTQETVQIKTDNPNELIQKLMDKMIQKTAAGKHEFEVQIEPQNLGKLAIKVAYEHESAVISIVCTNEKTLNLLSQGARNIAMIMEAHLGTPTTIYVDKGEENYLNQYKEQQGNQQQQQQQQSNQNEKSSREDGYDFIQQLRLGLTGMQEQVSFM